MSKYPKHSLVTTFARIEDCPGDLATAMLNERGRNAIYKARGLSVPEAMINLADGLEALAREIRRTVKEHADARAK